MFPTFIVSFKSWLEDGIPGGRTTGERQAGQTGQGREQQQEQLGWHTFRHEESCTETQTRELEINVGATGRLIW